MLSESILVLATAALSAATPYRRHGGYGGYGGYGSGHDSHTESCSNEPVIPTLPTANNGDHELADPTADVSLAAIGLGHGIQNYTCIPDGNGGLKSQALGALAVLYDITDLYPGTSEHSLPTKNAFNSLTIPVLAMQPLPLNLNETTTTATSVPATLSPFIDPPTDLTIKGRTYPYLGRHFFDADGVPTFDLMQERGLLAVLKKDDSTPAPSSAYVGPMGTGTVAWLLLSDKGTSNGVSFVYRVNTAGGVAQPCEVEGDSGSVSYSAMYWFYVPGAE